MKRLIPCIAIIGVSISSAYSQELTSLDSSPRLMLYMRMNVGTTNHKLAAPRFGLSLDRDISSQFSNNWLQPTLRRSISLLDIQFTTQGTQALNLGGAAMLNSDGSSRSVWKNPWLWVGIGAGALAISCASDNFPCSGGSDGSGGSGSGGGGY
ncbi:MAG: hypothetical protein H7Y02_13230 [Candidatus Obscuribacterales bacterium]|nr:hypothetical protein [Steroidobacteraceae bacterium]